MINQFSIDYASKLWLWPVKDYSIIPSTAHTIVSLPHTHTPPHLGNVDSRPEQLQMLSHLGWLVFGVEYGQLGEHAHVSSLQAQGGLHQCDKLVEVAPVLIVVDEIF